MESCAGSITQTSSNILEIFWGLSSLDENEQLGAAKQLISSLKEAQVSSDERVCTEVQYSLKRLVRGLASNRKGARQGYFIALTELLTGFPAVPLSQLFDLIHTHLEPTASDKTAEERGAYFGKVFALLALVRSGSLQEDDDILNVAKQLWSCWHRKSFLREVCSVSIGHLVEMCHAAQKDDVIKDHVISLLGLEMGWDGCTPEKLYLVLHLSSLYGKDKWFRDLVVKKFGSKHILSHHNFDKLGKVLVESTSSHPQLHSVWSPVLETVRVNGHFDAFWKCVVDDSLFLSSHERKYLGFKLLETLIPSLTLSEIPTILSANLLSCLLNNSFTKQNYLHAAAKHLLSQISALIASTNDMDLLVKLYIHLQLSTGNKFDQLTGTKVTEEALAKLSADGVEKLLSSLQASFSDPTSTCMSIVSTSDKEPLNAHSIQLWSLNQILFVLRHHKVTKSDSLILRAIKFLLLISLFDTSSFTNNSTLGCLPKAPLDVSLRNTSLQRLHSALADISSMTLGDEETEESKDVSDKKKETTHEEEVNVKGKIRGRRFRLPGVMEDGGYFLTALLQFVDEIMQKDGVTLVEEFTNESTETWDTVSQVISALSNKDCLLTEERAFLLLFSAFGLRLLCSKEERNTTIKTIQEVNICYNEMSQAHAKKKTRTPKKTTSRAKEGRGWMAVLTDVLLGCLSQPSQLWRNIVEQVFKQLTHCVTADSLQLILEVLEPKQSKEDLMEINGDDGDSGEGSDDSDGGESGDSGEGGDSDDDVSGDDTSVTGDPGEGGIGVDPAFRADVRRALGAAAVDSDAESESSLDDDAMMAVNDALAEVFTTRFALKHQKKIQRDEDRSVVHFKLRVLGLVEAFVRKESTNPLVLDLVLPLYEVIQASQSIRDHAPLVKKAGYIFSTRLCHMKEYPKMGIDVTHLHSCLHKLVDHLSKANSNTAPFLTQGFLFLVRVLRGNSSLPVVSPVTTRAGRKRKHCLQEEESEVKKVEGHGLLNVSEVTEWLSDALHNFITTKNSNINPVFFSTYVQRYPTLASRLVPKLIEDLPAAANDFRKTRAYELLSTIRSQTSGDCTDSPFNKLSNEDFEAMDVMTTKTKKRKRIKHKK